MQLSDAQLRPIVESFGHDWTSFCAARIFCPHLIERFLHLHFSKTRLAHYTSTENAMKIVDGRSVWLRNVRCMNDFSEVQWGARLLETFFDSSAATPFWSTLESIQPGIRERTSTQYRGWAKDFISNTYVFCLSEHASEDDLGRLSMWRAYATNNGCALILDSAPFYQVSDALGTYSYPVCYKSGESAFQMFQSIVKGVCENVDFLRTLPAEALDERVFAMMEYHAICMKHPAFAEEREWRVVHRPVQNPNKRMEPLIVPIKGLVQKIYRLPLENVPEENLNGIEPSQIIRRILLGPSLDSAIAREAIIEKLRELNFQNPESIVRETYIPLRT